MPVEYLNPEGLFEPANYWQCAVATGTRTLYMSGQADRGPDAKPVAGAGDLAGQVEQAFVNVDTAVRGAGGSFDDIAKLTVYLVDWTPDKMADVGAGIQRAAIRIGRDLRKPVTFLGVAALFTPDLLVEIDAVAVLP
jgi:enamine deaminase RidA (YjgF/YER057c/UK114 family)